ncbi:unnamed protein product [Moneuplotes crassus]|uniref:Uncharacterized protein n=2 Tax=Euplotes crassus TaxID=5936 RepID=A0AAD1XV06_EUPCR|nr:unnamed protein product [Moneuplotes crassus]
MGCCGIGGSERVDEKDMKKDEAGLKIISDQKEAIETFSGKKYSVFVPKSYDSKAGEKDTFRYRAIVETADTSKKDNESAKILVVLNEKAETGKPKKYTVVKVEKYTATVEKPDAKDENAGKAARDAPAAQDGS